MRFSFAQRTTVTYSSAAVLCVALPLMVPAEHERAAISVALFVGAPLAALAVLLACLHIAVGLQTRVDWLLATVFAAAAVLGVQPTWYWWPGLGSALARLGPGAAAAASAALAWLAVRAWRAPSPTRYVLGVGVALVALRFATSAHLGLVDSPGGIDSAADYLSGFLIDCAVSSTVLLGGLVGHRLLRKKAIAESRLTSA